MDQSDVMKFGGDLTLAAADQPLLEHVLAGANRMVLATSVDGNSSAAPLQFVLDGQDLIFVCCKASRIAAQVATNSSVQAVIWPCEQGSELGVEISGHCSEILDQAGRIRAVALLQAGVHVPQQAIHDVTGKVPSEFGCFRLSPTRTALVDTLAIPRFAWRDFPQNEPSHPLQALRALSRWMRLWVHAVRAPFFTAALVPVLLGGAIASYAMRRAGEGQEWSWAIFVWALVGAVLAAAGTNLINDYGDHTSGADDQNQVGANAFTGGSRMIQLGLLAPWKVLAASIACFGATIWIGLHINALIAGSAFAPTPLLMIGALGCALGVAYTVGPFPLSYRGFGEVAVAVGFGPVIVLGTSYVLTAGGATPWPVFASVVASLPVSVFILLVLWINQFQDAPADAISGKRNWVVRIAQDRDMAFTYDRVFGIYRLFNLVGFTLIVALGVLGVVTPGLATPYAWLALLPFPLFFRADRLGRRWVERWRDPNEDRKRLPFDLLQVNAMSVLLHLSTGALLALAYLLGS
ncbi:prenyltransferase [Thiomonas sp. FB-Cd]|uniref:prenyltransferase n=1 Tax=Thiomonas sp. FB-Cd TaxID=1158292 RepID=UPI0004DF5F83|nr:prenyltransferase [Thiomonas sp. FB-Cd]